MIKASDQDKDGKLNFEEFQSMMLSTLGGQPESESDIESGASEEETIDPEALALLEGVGGDILDLSGFKFALP